jgi:hypothetical protein
VFGLAKAVSLFAYVIAIRWRLRTTAAGGEDRLRRRFARACSAFLIFLTALWLLFVARQALAAFAQASRLMPAAAGTRLPD